MSITDNQHHELGNENGTHLQLYSENRFTVRPEPIMDVLEVLTTNKSLRELANVQFFFRRFLKKAAI